MGLKSDVIAIYLGLSRMVPSSSAIVLRSMVQKVNEGMCVIEIGYCRIRTWTPG